MSSGRRRLYNKKQIMLGLVVIKTNAMFAIRIFTDYYLDVPAMPNV